MKTVILISCALFASTFLQAQENNNNNRNNFERENLNFRIGPEVGFPLGKMNNTQGLGIGGSALIDIPVARRFSLIFYAGYVSFAGDKMPASDKKYSPTSVVPLRTGFNYKLTPNFYATAQLGEVTAKFLYVSKAGVSQALGLGYFNSKLDISARWDHQYVHGGLGSFNVKLAYVIEVGLKK